MSKKIQAIRGMKDLLPKDSTLWLQVEQTIGTLFSAYGYKNIRTPMIEKTSTFCRAIGEVTDIVGKEMYSWQDTNAESISLRPEGTAGCVRAMIEHNLPREGLQKVFYLGAMFRRERPQKGRYRQFHQAGVEVFGSNNAKSDAELIMMSHSLWNELGLKNLHLEINTLGSEAARANYKGILVDYFNQHKNQLDKDSLERLAANPLRILDSKNAKLQNLINTAPKLIDYIDKESVEHFDEFKTYLKYLNIPYQINPRLVRGLDYYNRTVFEWTTPDLGTQETICAGGRYDGLVEKMGGKPTPAAGFAIGLERLILLLGAQNITLINKPPLSIYLAVLGDEAQLKSMQIFTKLRRALPGVILYNDINLGSFKSQFKKANKVGADFALILGTEELNNKQVSIKPLKRQGEQQSMTLDKAIDYFKSIL